MKELVFDYLNLSYEVKIDEDSGLFIITDKTTNNQISYYRLKGVMYKIFGKTDLIQECCKNFVTNHIVI